MKKEKILFVVDKKSFDSVASAAIANLGLDNMKVLAVDGGNAGARMLKFLRSESCEKYDRLFFSGVSIDEDTAIIADNRFRNRVRAFSNSPKDLAMSRNYDWIDVNCSFSDNEPQLSLSSMVYGFLLDNGALKNSESALDSFTMKIDAEINGKTLGSSVAVEDLFDAMGNVDRYVNLLYRRLKFNIIRGENFKLNIADEEMIDEETRLMREYSYVSTEF